MSDEELTELFRLRPDAAYPLPPGFSSLAARLTLPGSLARAVRALTALELAALETAGDLGGELEPVPVQEIVETLPVPAERSHQALGRLRAAGLIFGTDMVRVTPGSLNALPPGWRVRDVVPEDVDKLIAQLSDAERAVLNTLARSGSVGTTRDAGPDAAPERPVPQLLAKGLLARMNASTVRLPRPVRDALRGTPPREYPLSPRELSASEEPNTGSAAATQGLEAVRTMRRLFTHLGTSPAPLNKDGSVGVRALAGLAKELEAPENEIALLITAGEAAGLIGRGEIDVDTNALAPTKDAPSWADARLADQWAILVAGWVASPWRTELLGERDAKGNPIRLLGQAMHSPDVRRARTLVLSEWCRTPGVPATVEGISHNLRYTAPVLSSGISDDLIRTFSDEAHFFGALAGGAASSVLAAVLAGEDAVAAATELVPDEVTYVIPQADMTILAPGPLAPDMHATLESFTALESPGLASVFRVREDSVRRALDTGRTPDELIAWLQEHSPAGVPQPLEFLIRDASRHLGQVRAGSAGSYIRSDDEGLIAEAASLLGGDLRQIAPQAAISPLPLTQLLGKLREAGMHPTAEDEMGATIHFAPEPVMVAATPSTIAREPRIDEAHLAKAVEAIRADSSSEAPSASQAEGHNDHLSVLQAAARAGKPVAIGYVNKNGTGNQVTVTPLSVSAGQVDALNEKTGAVVRIALPRITKVILA